jgi:hypothetical protein
MTNPRKLKREQDKLLAAAQKFVSDYFDDFAMIQLLDWKTEAYRHRDQYGVVEFSYDQEGNRSIVSATDPLPEGHEKQLILPYIDAIESWKNTIMADYLLNRKIELLKGNLVSKDFTNHGEPPLSFTDMFLIVTPSLRPDGWDYPIL